MARACRHYFPITLLFLLPAAGAAAQSATPPEAAPGLPAGPGGAEPEKGGGGGGVDDGVRERILRRVDELLRARRERILEEVRRIIDEEMRGPGGGRRGEGRDPGARIERAVERLEALVRRLRELKASVDLAVAAAEKALEEKREAAPGGGGPESPPAAAGGVELPAVPEPLQNFYQAMSLYESGEYEKAIEGFTRVAAGLDAVLSGPAAGPRAVSRPEARVYRGEALYRVACCHAVLGQADPALQTLEQAIRGGFRRTDQMEDDAELDTLREDPRFDRLLRLARSQRG